MTVPCFAVRGGAVTSPDSQRYGEEPVQERLALCVLPNLHLTIHSSYSDHVMQRLELARDGHALALVRSFLTFTCSLGHDTSFLSQV